MSDDEKKLKHIRKYGTVREAPCGAKVETEMILVDVARESDCDDCRAALLIAPVKDLPVKGPPEYAPEPYADIEPLENLRARRDGR